MSNILIRIIVPVAFIASFFLLQSPSSWAILPAAFILDLAVGDPRRLPHPIVWMGNAISFFEPRFRKWIKKEILSGFFFALFLITGTWVSAFFTIELFSRIHPLAGNMAEIVLLFFCFSVKTLSTAAYEVKNALEKKGLEAGRQAVAMIVGREVKYLDETGVAAAAVETVAENFVDGFLSPLFFFLIGGVPMAMAYKMINTLDSMVGYRNDRYLLFGRAAARIDDIANFIPARLSVLFISLTTAVISRKRGMLALETAFKEGKRHKSPNAGYPEASFAGALKMKLGGPNYYHGTLVEKPYIGGQFKRPDLDKLSMSCDLMVLSSFIAMLFCFIVTVIS